MLIYSVVGSIKKKNLNTSVGLATWTLHNNVCPSIQEENKALGLISNLCSKRYAGVLCHNGLVVMEPVQLPKAHMSLHTHLIT